MNVEQYIYRPGAGVRLDSIATRTMGPFRDDDDARSHLRNEADALAKHHDYLMAHGDNGVLVIFQGMDAAGKDEAIRHVMSVIDPQGCEVKMFKRPTEKDVLHDFLWRAASSAPARGQIGIFNRSYYEHVVAERVHPDRLDRQCLSDEARADVYEKRLRHIVNFETMLCENGIHIVKLFFHVSKEEQRQRLIERIDRPDKRWQFAPEDIEDREYWAEYMEAYNEAFTATSTDAAPWHVIPADCKWFSRAAAATIITDKLKSLHNDYPDLGEKRAELDQARATLEAQAGHE